MAGAFAGVRKYLGVRKSLVLLLAVTAILTPACGSGAGVGESASLPPSGPLMLTTVSPSEAAIGVEIHVSGSGFGYVQGTSTLTVSGIGAVIVAWSENLIRATVPPGATTGSVVVWVGGIPSNSGTLGVLWSATAPVNLPICTIPGGQQESQVVSDGNGGAIIVWVDARSGNADIYAQRVDSVGVPQWAADGIPICTAADNQFSPVLVSDGSGGAIIAWQDHRGGSTNDIYAQRVDASGTTLWTADGVAVCVATDEQDDPRILADDSGGAFLVWTDYRSGTNNDIYAQRLNAAGVPQWSIDGLPVVTTATNQQDPRMAPDGAGGVIVVWEEVASGDVYGQRLDAAGTIQWAVSGVVITAAVDIQAGAVLVSDGSGGAIVVWADRRSGMTHIYGQRVDSLGVPLWAADGIPICTAAQGEDEPRIISDGAGGAIVVWTGFQGAPDDDIYAQRVDGNGNRLWTTDGVVVCGATGDQRRPRIVPDQLGGAIILWNDLRSGVQEDLYAQRIDSQGIPQWIVDGVAVRTSINGTNPGQIASDGRGGAVAVWDDTRSGPPPHIYAQGLSPAGRE
jgi:hypothetical protein